MNDSSQPPALNVKARPLSPVQRALKILRTIAVIALVTLLLLEVMARLLWWNKQGLAILDKTITLFPLPLVNEEQLNILEDWLDNPQTYLQYDPVLGWSIRPNVTAPWEGTIYTSNSLGLRSLREYDLITPAGVTRLAAFGPSFTHGDEVQGHETWEAQMEQLRPDLEVMNWGIGGYGTDQSLLRYRTQGAAYRPSIVIIGFEEDNLGRNVNRYRPYFRSGTGLPLTKPVFASRGNDLVLLENPFADFDTFYTTLRHEPARFLDLTCPDDFFCRRERYQPLPLDIFHSFRFFRTLADELEQAGVVSKPLIQDPYVQRVNFGLIGIFVKEVLQNGSIPIVLIFPELSSIQTHEHGGATAYAAAITMLREQGVQVIDLAPAFVQDKITQNRTYSDYYASEGGHFNALGNQVVAQTVYWHLCSQGLLINCK